MSSLLKTHGYSPGENAVILATDESRGATDALVDLTPIPCDLTALHWAVWEVSLPDVEHGYFVDHTPESRHASLFNQQV